MLSSLHQELQAHHLPGEQLHQLSMYSGGALHYVSSLCVDPLVYHALMLHDRGAAALMRLMMAGVALVDILPGRGVLLLGSGGGRGVAEGVLEGREEGGRILVDRGRGVAEGNNRDGIRGHIAR